MELIEEYRWRGLLQDATEGAAEMLRTQPRTLYIGFDPTASSLHVGNLLTVMGLVHAQRAGHHPIALVGGGTGLIGDPSGKTQERQLLSREDVERNVAGIHSQLERFLDFEARTNPARMVNNLEWLGPMPLLEFLRDTGKHFSINALLGKESIRRRVSSDEVGLSYTEFSYVLLQAYDFLALYDRYDCAGQMGGSDQWGNITAGIDLIRRVRQGKAFGVVWPLMTTSSGVKFGKTESGAVWLDAERTSPFRFYQFWLNTDDADALRWLRAFTLMDQGQIDRLATDLVADPGGRAAQRALAEDVTRRVHGEDGLARALRATQVLFGGALDGMSADEIADVFADVPSSELARGRLSGEGLPLIELLAEAGVVGSRSDARRSLDSGGIYLNGARVDSVDRRVTVVDSIEGRFLLLRKGKKNYHLVRLLG